MQSNELRATGSAGARAPAAPLRLAIIHNIPSPYRLPLFARLAADARLRVLVLFQAAGARERTTWRAPRAPGFDAEWLPAGSRWRAAPAVAGALRRFRPDAVVIGGYDSVASLAALAYCRLRGIPCILWSGSTTNESSGRRRLKESMKRRIIAACSACIAYGSRAQAYLEQLGADPGRIAIAPNTVDVAFFREAAAALDPDAERRRLGLPVGRPVALFAGQLIARKDPAALLAALHRLKLDGIEVTALYVGDGPLREDVMRAAGLAGIDARFLPAAPPEEMPRHYVASDVLVLPSREEVWGLVANEAMACGRPVIISTACGAAADLVEDGVSGFVVAPGDVGGLAAAVRALVTDAARGAAMGAAAATRAEGFTIEREAAGFIEALRLVAPGRL